jgi:hypothetical protein
MATRRRRDIRYGNDLYREILPPDARKSLKVTYWDLWLVDVLTREFDGNWDRLGDHFHTEKTGSSYRRYKAEELLNHWRLLRQALDRGALTANDILAQADPDLLLKQYRRARRKVLEMDFRDDEISPWMIHTPRREREARAIRGYWHRFPISPEEYAASLESLYTASSWYSKDRSLALERRLSAFVESKEADASLAELFALYRATVTVLTEKMGLVDDSYGVVGTLCQQVFEKYTQLDRAALDMSLEILLQDLVELMIWEDYAGTHTGGPIFFADLAAHEVPLGESILQEQWHELCDLELDYHAEKALTMLGMLYERQQMFDKFVPVARAMGTRAWQRITAMSEAAEKRGRYKLALAVYEACLGPGLHEDFLRRRYREPKGRLGSD